MASDPELIRTRGRIAEIRRAVEETLADWEYDTDGTTPAEDPGDDGTLAEENVQPEASEAGE